MLEGFSYVQRFRVVFGDVDMMHHVNNVVYLRWAETVRVDYVHDVIGGNFSLDGQTSPILVKLEATYEVPLRFREKVAAGGRVTRIGNRSLDFAVEIWSEDRGIRCAQTVATLVTYDYAAERSVTVPDAWRDAIFKHEELQPVVKT